MKFNEIEILGLDFFVIAIVPFALVIIFTWCIIKYAVQLGLVDIPNERKVHKIPTPSLGGIAVISGLCISSLFFINGDTEIIFLLILVTTFGLSMLGAYDDLKNASPVLRLFVESAMVLTLVFFADLSIAPVVVFLGFGAPNELLDGIMATIFCVAMINAFNFIDGINGLSGSIFTINFICLAFGFFSTGYFELGVLSTLTAMAIPGFLVFNFFNAKIFLGDSGSIALGYLNTVLVMYLIDHISNVHIGNLHFDAVDFMALLLLPAADMVKVIFGRVLQGKSPMKADKTHLHHLMLQLNGSHLISTCTIVGFHIIAIATPLVLANVSVAFMISLLLIYTVSIYFFTYFSLGRFSFSKVSLFFTNE